MHTHFPGCKVNDHPAPPANLSKLLVEENREVAFITEERVRWSINSFKPNKAPGPDGIKPLVLRNLGPKLLKRLTTFYRASVTLGQLPTGMCQSKVIFIPKAGKDDYTIPKAFRPVST